MRYSVNKTSSGGLLMWYVVDAHRTEIKDGTVYFYNQAGGLEGAFRDFDSIVPEKELK